MELFWLAFFCMQGCFMENFFSLLLRSQNGWENVSEKNTIGKYCFVHSNKPLETFPPNCSFTVSSFERGTWNFQGSFDIKNVPFSVLRKMQPHQNLLGLVQASDTTNQRLNYLSLVSPQNGWTQKHFPYNGFPLVLSLAIAQSSYMMLSQWTAIF